MRVHFLRNEIVSVVVLGSEEVLVHAIKLDFVYFCFHNDFVSQVKGAFEILKLSEVFRQKVHHRSQTIVDRLSEHSRLLFAAVVFD